MKLLNDDVFEDLHTKGSQYSWFGDPSLQGVIGIHVAKDSLHLCSNPKHALHFSVIGSGHKDMEWIFRIDLSFVGCPSRCGDGWRLDLRLDAREAPPTRKG